MMDPRHAGQQDWCFDVHNMSGVPARDLQKADLERPPSLSMGFAEVLEEAVRAV